jgi:predicted transcriptional regulator
VSIRDTVFAALADGPQTFPELHKRIGGRRQAIMQVLILAQDAGTVAREGTRRRYVYALAAPGTPRRERAAPTPRAPASELWQVWR